MSRELISDLANHSLFSANVTESQTRHLSTAIMNPQNNTLHAANEKEKKMKSIEITKENFDREVTSAEGTVLLDFWAWWCIPCRMLSPTIEKIAEEHPDIKVGKINVDKQRELAGRFNIMSIPTLVVMKNGKIVEQSVGVQPKQAITKMITAY